MPWVTKEATTEFDWRDQGKTLIRAESKNKKMVCSNDLTVEVKLFYKSEF